MAVTAKFVAQFKQPSESGFYVTLGAVTSGSEENKSFFKYTPGGQISLYTVNQEAADQFVVGKEYYITFTEATNIASN